jgi:deoxyribodipyrimidine photolyase
MELDVRARTKIALQKEMDLLQHANNLYRRREDSQTGTAKAVYEFRNRRLEEIRTELERLQSELKLV